MIYASLFEYFIELGKICIEIAKFFDQHGALNSRGNNILQLFLVSVYCYEEKQKIIPAIFDNDFTFSRPTSS